MDRFCLKRLIEKSVSNCNYRWTNKLGSYIIYVYNILLFILYINTLTILTHINIIHFRVLYTNTTILTHTNMIHEKAILHRMGIGLVFAMNITMTTLIKGILL